MDAGLKRELEAKVYAGERLTREDGIALYESAATNTHIEGNFIGTDATGTVANSNGNAGIYFQRANGNRRLTFMQF